MKVLFVCTYNFKNSQTGAGTQVRETYNHLKTIGHEVTQIFVKFNPLIIENQEGVVIEPDKMTELISNHDVAHLIHCSRFMARSWRELNSVSKIPTVGSTIFWAGPERVQMTFKTYPFGRDMIRVASVFARSMMRWYNDFRGVDVFLPNSQAEAQVVGRYFKKNPNSKVFPVPNGFIAPSFDLEKCKKDHEIPFNDYIVVPGVFANRKNQLGFIKALSGADYPVVFIGGSCEDEGRVNWFYRKCRDSANEKMLFLGYVPSSSERYWSILANARCACLASDCETPGIAMIEAAYAGARPIITKFGGTAEYYGFDAEYLDPRSNQSIINAVEKAWMRGRLTPEESAYYRRYSWFYCARLTTDAYELAVDGLNK